ncbi:heavy-metal-associated domain-containing protein, partial [Serratia marcescens]|uniref:heavy-metal-associated domain-containing protein n=1 Tax=Serratia marcescens TaxID=615 RepID=UPI0029D9792F
IDSSKPTCRQNRCCKNGSDHRFRFLRRPLKAIPGVDDVVVSLSTGEAAVRYDEQLTSPDQLKSAVKGAGYGVSAAKATPNH